MAKAMAFPELPELKMKMTNRRNCRRAGLAAVAALMLVALILRPPLWYYTDFTFHPHLLPTRLIKPALRFCSGHDAPAMLKEAQGIVQGGRDPAVFVRFRTDDQGLRYIVQEFGRPGAPVKLLDMEVVHEIGWPVFTTMLSWQRELGVDVYDPPTIRSARVLTCESPGGLGPTSYVLIDEEQHTVYILAFRNM